jgi:hypothetical protein
VASTYSLMRSGFLGSLVYLRLNIDVKPFKLFRYFLILKVVCTFAFRDGIHWPINPEAIPIIFIILIAALLRIHFLGLFLAFGLSCLELLLSWPFTINHSGLECAILLLMCLMPELESNKSKISIENMVKILMMSVWFFSGIHKLLDGYYLNGEFFALETLANNTTLGHHLNDILSCFSNKTLLFLSLSWITIIAEIILPFSLLIPKFKTLGIILLLICQGLIAYFSGEIDFAFTAFAILFLFIPQLAAFTYPSLACLMLLVQPWV